MASEVEELDLVVGGHSHTFLYTGRFNGSHSHTFLYTGRFSGGHSHTFL